MSRCANHRSYKSEKYVLNKAAVAPVAIAGAHVPQTVAVPPPTANPIKRLLSSENRNVETGAGVLEAAKARRGFSEVLWRPSRPSESCGVLRSLLKSCQGRRDF